MGFNLISSGSFCVSSLLLPSLKSGTKVFQFFPDTKKERNDYFFLLHRNKRNTCKQFIQKTDERRMRGPCVVFPHPHCSPNVPRVFHISAGSTVLGLNTQLDSPKLQEAFFVASKVAWWMSVYHQALSQVLRIWAYYLPYKNLLE